jgi:hypothetical protein
LKIIDLSEGTNDFSDRILPGLQGLIRLFDPPDPSDQPDRPA